MSDSEQPPLCPSCTGHQCQHVQVNKGAKAHIGDAYHISHENPLSPLLFASNAPVNSYYRQHKPACLPNTRVDVLQKISQWADGEGQQCLFWLSGMAGTGKSTIAHTVAHSYLKKDQLAASFFFSRGGGDVGNASKFVTTIAMQLSDYIQPVQRHIRNAVAEHRIIANLSLIDQWRQLVLGPLLKLDGSDTYPWYIVVIDALDECEGEEYVRTIIQLLAEARSLTKVRLLVLVTSRPEVPIRYCFSQIPKIEYRDFILHDMEAANVDHDIFIFLDHEMGSIGQEWSLGAGWPGEQALKRLVLNASGLFIWAATACRFIREGRSYAAKRLSMLAGSTSTLAPELHLYDVYMTVLRSTIREEYLEEEKEHRYLVLKEVLGTIVLLNSPLSVDSLPKLLHLPKGDVDGGLADLHAILDIPKDTSRPLRLHHPSFRDFLLDKGRCSDHFWVNEKRTHGALAENCIRLMSATLKQDICRLHAPGTLTADVDSSHVKECLPPAVQYACLYWGQHLQRSDAQLCDLDQAYTFLQKHFLHWLEALSLMGKTSDGVLAITSLESIIQVNGSPHLYAFIQDAKRFVLYSRYIIQEAPLQIYCSALVFAPEMSIVRQQFKGLIPPWIGNKLPRVRNNWSSLLQTLEGHFQSVNAVAVSPNGQLVASASDDCTIRLWDSTTGAPRDILKGHSRPVNAVVFSPDGQLVASGSGDGTVRLWDYTTGVLYSTLSHSWPVNAVAFSPDSQIVASGSMDREVKLWDCKTGALRDTLKGHFQSVSAVVFSLDGQLVASASRDSTIRLWDNATGALRNILTGHSGVVKAVAFSPDSRLVASASEDSTVRLWNCATGALYSALSGHSSFVSAVAFSPNGQLVVSASYDRTVRLWDSITGAPRSILKGHLKCVNAVVFSLNGQLIISGSRDNTVRLWEPLIEAPRNTLESHSGSVNAVVFSPNGQLVASASQDNTVRIWDCATGASRNILEGHSGSINAVAFSPEGQIVASTSSDQTVGLWDSATGAPRHRSYCHSESINAVAFSPDGLLVAYVKLYPALVLDSRSNEDDWRRADDWRRVVDRRKVDRWVVRLWDSRIGTSPGELEGDWSRINAVAFSPDSQLVASASEDGIVRLWDCATRALYSMLKVHWGSVNDIVFSPDGCLIASRSADRTVRLWDPRTGASRIIEGRSVNAVAFSPHGQLLASTSDGTIKLYDCATGELCDTLKVNFVSQRLSFSNNGLLETDRGLLSILSYPAGVVSSSHNIFVAEHWVARGKENILWLPPEYRATCVAVRNSRLILGHASGQVTFFRFDLAKMHYV